MRIALDARYLSADFSGIGVYSRSLIEAMGKLPRATEHEFIVIVHSSFREHLDVPDNFEVVSDPSNPVSLRTLSSFQGLLKQLKADTLHSLFPLAPLTWSGRQVLTVHDLQPLIDPDFSARRPRLQRAAYEAFYRITYPLCMRRADCLVAVSYSTKEDIRHLMPDLAEKALVVHSGVPEECFEEPTPEQIALTRERYDLPGRYLLYLGSTRPNKNLSRMLDAFERWAKSHPEHDDVAWVLVLKSDRFFEPVLATIRDRGLLKRIHVHEQVTEAEKRVMYRSATLLYFVTKHEGFGFPVLEAQAQGLPVLASTDGALPEIAGRGAMLVDPDDTEAISAALEEFFAEPTLSATFAEAGKENARRFTWERAATDVLDVYEHILD